jgi:hypothetical protein
MEASPAGGMSISGQLRLLDRSGSLLGVADARGNGVLHPFVVLV